MDPHSHGGFVYGSARSTIVQNTGTAPHAIAPAQRTQTWKDLWLFTLCNFSTHVYCKFTDLHTVHTKSIHWSPTETNDLTGSHCLASSVSPWQGKGMVEWATGVECKVSGNRIKFPSRSQLAACLLARELHHTARRPAWSATSDLSARESAGGKERQTDREKERERTLKYCALQFRLMKRLLDRLKDVSLIDSVCTCFLSRPIKNLSALLN